MEPLISVIVPVYKVEPYLRQCVDSIRNQTYTNLEIILVDDGSPDGCPEICDEYAVLDPRIKVIHKENGGASRARNSGLAAAQGDYITFVDSDDWVDCRLYEHVMKTAPFDAALFGCTLFFPESNDFQEVAAADMVTELPWSNAGKIVKELAINSLLGYTCNKIFAKTLVEGLYFPIVQDREDLIFNLSVFRKTAGIKLIDHTGYYYVQRDASLLHKPYSGSVPDIGAIAQQLTSIHPDLPHADNQLIANIILKHLICDMVTKYVIRNRTIDQPSAIAAMEQLFSNRDIRRTLRLCRKDCRLHMLLTICMKLHMPGIFYLIAKRTLHE